MSSKKEHVDRLVDEIHEINKDDHIKEPDEFVAIDAIEKAVFKLQSAFERDPEYEGK